MDPYFWIQKFYPYVIKVFIVIELKMNVNNLFNVNYGVQVDLEDILTSRFPAHNSGLDLYQLYRSTPKNAVRY